MQDVKLENILGLSKDGQWLGDEDYATVKGHEEENTSESDGQSI